MDLLTSTYYALALAPHFYFYFYASSLTAMHHTLSHAHHARVHDDDGGDDIFPVTRVSEAAATAAVGLIKQQCDCWREYSSGPSS